MAQLGVIWADGVWNLAAWNTAIWEQAGGPDTTPDAFSFTDQPDVARSTVITSAPITIAGIDAPTNISVTGGEYSINGGAFTSTPGNVNNGDQVRTRHTSSASYSTAVNTTVTIGGVSDTFTSTTGADPGVWAGVGFVGGTAVDVHGIMGTIFLDDSTPVPAASYFVNGFAHNENGMRYVANWPGTGVVYFHAQQGVARRSDGAMIIVSSGTIAIRLAGWALTARGEVLVSTSQPDLIQGGYGLLSDGKLCVSDAS